MNAIDIRKYYKQMKKIIICSCLFLFLLTIFALFSNRITNILQKRDRIVIAMITDDNYALPTAVAITSIQMNKKDTTDLNIYVITNGLSDENKRLLSETKCELKEAKLDPLLDKVAIGKNKRSALLKFNLPNIFTQEKKVLYLDSDMIVQGDLAELFNIDLKDHYAAVTYDLLHFLKERREDLGLKKYFNSGVMLLNLEKMRKDGISKKLVDYKINSEPTTFIDQDTFNMVFNENVVFFHPRYNYLTNYSNAMHELGMDKKINIKTAIVIHEAGKKKSWKNSQTPSYYLWQKYYKQSPFKDIKGTK